MSATASQRDLLKQQIQDLLSSDLRAVQKLLSQQFSNPNMFVQDVAQHVSRFQGKQIRPILTLLSAKACGATAAQMTNVIRLAAVVEMIHSATLVHDDVIDDADLRRHVSTVHRRWNTETSVLFGDYLFSKAFHLAATTGDAEACRLIGRATNRTCEGELNQIAARLEQSKLESDYFRVIHGKTAQLFAVSCRLGARCAGASEDVQNRLSLYGCRLGLAFQIADDILDLTETAEQTGKDSANDLANHRLTLPILRALKEASREDNIQLRELMDSNLSTDRQRLKELPALRHGVLSAKATADELAGRAQKSLTSLPQTQCRRVLEQLALFSVGRSN